MYDVLLTIHLLAVILWFGGGATLHVLGRRALASGDAPRVLQFVRDAGWVGPRLYAPLSLVLVIAGSLLVSEAGHEFSQLWITLAYVGWAIAFAIGAGFYGRAVARVEAAAAQGDDAGIVSGARSIIAMNQVELGALALIVVDMVVKPGL